ncbi:hypothetical protein NBRC111894_3629 [Sporolactobacillus inulinus]|uniref:Uncharacterized protein n=1 Tax=Sporolactobacillus inulinus TaxID=2078 RepID=A0A4Y1ZG48_9BACL|nr:hypothetical protein NBRC111894_3629 [Sporolactobacillus inulinus]
MRCAQDVRLAEVPFPECGFHSSPCARTTLQLLACRGRTRRRLALSCLELTY